MIYSLIMFAAAPFFQPDLLIKNNPIHMNTFCWGREEYMSAFLETVFFFLLCLLTGFFFRLGQETANKICPPKGKNK